MISDVEAVYDLRLNRSFQRLWAIAFTVAAISAVPVVLLKAQVPWLIAVPIVAGVVIGITLEARDEFGQEIRDLDEDVATLSSDFKGLLAYTGHVVLELPKGSHEKDQELFAFLQPDKTTRKRATRVRLDSGEEIFVISCDRYVDLLVSRLLEESDKIVEHSLGVASKRFGALRPEQIKDRGFMTKSVLETLKSDFRGNWITVVSRNAERVIRELEKGANSEMEFKASNKRAA